MERSLCSRCRFITEKKMMKKKKKKQRPIKVVYIANPVRVTTTAAGFRGLVQKLTGRDSEAAAAAATPAGNCDDSSGPSSTSTSEMSGGGAAEARESNSLVAPAEVFDDKQMLENLFSGFMPSSALFNYEYLQRV